VEGFNTKAKLTTRKAYGFRTYRAAEIALYHALGALPVPKTTHEFFWLYPDLPTNELH
jgi:transposase